MELARGLFCRREGNKRQKNRASLEENPNTEGGCPVVKGISKRVIVVKSPDPRIFEQAIFIIREDFAGQSGVSEKDILREARNAAGRYLHSEKSPGQTLGFRLRGIWLALAGALAAAAAWLTLYLVNV